MKYQKNLVYLIMVTSSFSFSCGKDKTTNPETKMAPSASFIVIPSYGTTDVMFAVDASGSSDNQDPTSALQVPWDWENDGTFDTEWIATKTALHQYATEDTYSVKLQVKDTDGLTNIKIEQVIVYAGCGIVTDIDGNSHLTVQIGTQCWMAENLKVTHYRNGDALPNVTSNLEWDNLRTGAYCNYDNDAGNVAIYGLLYNWYAVSDSCGIAPEGWHVPSDAEWKQLEMYLGMSQSEADATGWRGTDEGVKMKATGTIEGGDGLWYFSNRAATNESGFSALPGGVRHIHGNIYFDGMGMDANFWSSTENNIVTAWSRYLYYDDSEVIRFDYDKQYGFSVRCIRD
jgi:uncharacterized protein (TIGR02145 family)